MPKYAVPVLTLVISAFLATPAKAYDEDTHFYGTYAMARHAGIKHEAAVKIALSAQWMDESFISDPTSMIFLPVTGIKKRRLLHFPSSRVSGAGSNSAQHQIFGMDELGEFAKSTAEKFAKWAGYEGDIEEINFFTETREDHPFASQMLMEGMKEGNLMKAATGLHTLEDSFAHAGTPAEQGHALFWHWPDRPYASTDKYQRMVRSVMHAMVALRTMLPPELRDCERNTAGGTRNCEADAAALTESYLPLVMPVASHDMMRDPEYVKIAMREFYQRAVKEGFTNLTPNEFEARLARLPLVDGQTDAYSAVQLFLKQVFAENSAESPRVFNFAKVLEAMGRLDSANAASVRAYVESYGRDGVRNMQADALENFTHVLATELLAWHVPANLTDTHRMEIEDDKDEVRKQEMEIRVKRMQEFVLRNFGIDLVFVGNNTLDDVGFYHELHMMPDAEPNFESKPGFVRKPGAVYATFSLREKNAFDHIILKYLFPELKDSTVNDLIEGFAKVKRSIINRSTYYAEHKKIREDASINWIVRIWRLIQLDAKYKRIRTLSADVPRETTAILKDVLPHAKEYIHDLVSTHITPSEDNFIYRQNRSFQAAIADHRLKPFCSDTDVWSARDLAPASAPNQAPASFWNTLF